MDEKQIPKLQFKEVIIWPHSHGQAPGELDVTWKIEWFW